MARCELPVGHASEFHRAGDTVWLDERAAWEERLDPQPGSIAHFDRYAQERGLTDDEDLAEGFADWLRDRHGWQGRLAVGSPPSRRSPPVPRTQLGYEWQAEGRHGAGSV